MPLSAEDLAGLDIESVAIALRDFDLKTVRRGRGYYNAGRVSNLDCEIPGQVYRASVQGGSNYEVSLEYIADGRKWSNFCTCPVGSDCKHAYAALEQLLAEHARAAVYSLSATDGEKSPFSRPAAPATFAETVRDTAGRKLTQEEAGYLRNISYLFQQATTGRLYYTNELTRLGIGPALRLWERLELYPATPKTEAEFWNYLALYLTEKLQKPIPEFLEPVTDLAGVREKMRRFQRGRVIAHWKQKLANLGDLAGTPAAAAAGPVDLRLRFTAAQAVMEWRSAGGPWTELKSRKLYDFENTHAAQLPVEAALLWLPYWQRSQVFGSTTLGYHDAWAKDQIGRWLRHPSLRPLLANEAGEPLVFHDDPVRWVVRQPEDEDGDYSFALMQAGGEPLPDAWLVTSTRPAFYLTPAGVFTGPAFDPQLAEMSSPTLIPARALESTGGLRLLHRLQVAPPPRLAARVRIIPLLRGICADLKTTGAGGTEYCYVDLYGVSEDGEYVEIWNGQNWAAKDSAVSQGNPKDFIQLDRSALGALIPPLQQAGFKWDYYAQRWTLRLTRKFPEIFVPFLQSLPAGTQINLSGELASFQNAEVSGKIRLEASETEMDWFDLRVIVDVSDATLTKEEIKLLLDAKGKWVRVGEKGWRKLEFTLSAEEDQELARLGLTPHELTSEPQRLHAFQLADPAARKFLPAETCDRIERRAAELQTRVTPPVPAEIQADMRPYQRDGFHFLCYLAANNFGGILADDMGLGKTLQALAWLAWLRQEAATGKTADATLPSLVVCPKSVADNWRAEAIKFFPGLKVRVWSARELKSFAGMLSSADLHVLNYSQLRLVGEDLARERFHAVILDEGQYIKNPSSITAQVARQLRAGHRLVLSGTPIENRLLDLWSLMSFAMPGALGSRAEFGRLYDGKGDPFARQRLAARVRPFLIRRTKTQVARDLPDRMEEDLFCELEGEQKMLYRAELKRAQAMLLGVKTAAALNKQRFNFLTSLLRLRQICCHPRLVKPDSKAASAKIEALVDTLEPLIKEGEKVLVFSQFVGLLDILRAELKARDWPHWYLAGATENRGELVQEFQTAEGAGVFLISLKAGGFGLNLTAASSVVLFDPWWNPAVENQAIDRTHRIGQTHKVIAYRLLIKDSIEEKIRTLQKQKSSLANDVLGEEKFSKSLSLDDLRYLLEG
jgi:hypothetical protein